MRSERRRSDKVAEHQGELPALGLGISFRVEGLDDGRWHVGQLTLAQRSNSIKQSSAMTDRGDAEITEIRELLQKAV